MDYSNFFEACRDHNWDVPEKPIHKLYYNDKGAIIDISYDLKEGVKYIEITQEEYDKCFSMTQDYEVVDEKLEYIGNRPKRTWDLKQQDLPTNPYMP